MDINMVFNRHMLSVFSLALRCSLSLFLLASVRAYAKDSIELGQELFEHAWKSEDALSPKGDGLGPMFNATSCRTCHHLGGVGGAGALSNNIDLLTAIPIDDAAALDIAKVKKAAAKLHHEFEQSSTILLHRSSTNRTYESWRRSLLGFKGDKIKPEKLASAERAFDSRISNGPLIDAVVANRSCRLVLSHRNTTSLFGVGLIDKIPESVLKEVATEQTKRFPEVHGRLCRTSSGHVGRFGWRGQVSSLREFVMAACAKEVGLQTASHRQALDPSSNVDNSSRFEGTDLAVDQCDALIAFISELPAPQQVLPKNQSDENFVRHGEKLFETIGCAGCHVRDLGSVQGIYSDLLLHDMGPGLEDPLGANPEVQTIKSETSISNAYGGVSGFVQIAKSSPLRREWKTPPLWGIQDSAPYLHDGRAATLEAAIAAHGGEGQSSLARFNALDDFNRRSIFSFLGTLKTGH